MKYRCAGIVTYNPEIGRLKENVEALHKQVDVLIIVDNFSNNIYEIEELTKMFYKVEIHRNKRNEGIAKALNQISFFAREKGYDWVLLMDQDSICSDNLLDVYNEYIHDQEIALISPFIVDINKMSLQEYYQLEQQKYIDCLWAITSGSLVRIETLFALGGFEEYLFIDGVDLEYSKRVQYNNFRQIRVNETYLLQEVGHAEPLKIKRFHKDMTGKWSIKPLYRTNHSQMRKYFMARNNIIIAKKYKLYESFFISLVKILAMNVSIFFIERDKKETACSIYKGLKDGFLYNIDSYKK